MTDDRPGRSPLREELSIVYRNRWWAIGPVIVALLATAGYNTMSRPVYVTEAVLALERRVRFPGAPQNFDPRAIDAAVSEQMRALRSLSLAESVVDSQNERIVNELRTGPMATGIPGIIARLRELFRSGAPALTGKHDWIGAFASRLDFSQTTSPTWIVARFSSYDPVAGADAANALIDLYIEQLKKSNDAALVAERESFEQVLGTQKAQLGGAMEALSEESKGVNPTAEKAMAQRQMASLQDQYAGVTSRIVVLTAELAAGRTDAMPATSARAQSLQSKLDEVRAELAARQESLGERHPEVLSLLSQARSIESGLRAESVIERGRLQAELATLTRQRDSLGAAVRNAMSRYSSTNADALDTSVLIRQADAGERALSDLIDRSQRGSDLMLFNARLIQPARPAPRPASPEAYPNFARALLVGLLFGLALTKLRESLNETVRTLDEVRTLDRDLHFLGAVPLDHRVGNGGLAALFNDSTPLAEAYRVVKANLPADARVLAITSARPGDGKSTTAAALAILLSDGGESVLLVDGDLRRPSLHRVLDVDAERGLGEALRTGSFDEFIVRIDGVDFLPAGKSESNAAALLGAEALKRLVRLARKQYRYVIIDTPPALALADASSIGREVDGTILVVASGLTPKGALLATTEQLRRQGIVILGVILNRLDFNERLNGYGSYYRAYDKYYSSKSEPRTGISMWPWKRAVPVAPPGPKDGPDGRRVKRGAA